MSERQTYTIEETAAKLGISRNLCYELARREELPVPVLRLGRRCLIPKAALDRILDAEEVEA
jgi:excisionase family DNA binding protein